MDLTLFISAFISATLLPGTSEALLLYKLSQNQSVSVLLISATAGNLLGSLVTYGIGVAGNHAARKRWLSIKDETLLKAEHWFQRWGIFSLFFAWLPIIGDPLCLVAGLMRVRLAVFTLIVAVGKFFRYAFLVIMVA